MDANLLVRPKYIRRLDMRYIISDCVYSSMGI